MSCTVAISLQILKPAEKKKPNSSRPVTPPRNMVTKQAKKWGTSALAVFGLFGCFILFVIALQSFSSGIVVFLKSLETVDSPSVFPIFFYSLTVPKKYWTPKLHEPWMHQDAHFFHIFYFSSIYYMHSGKDLTLFLHQLMQGTFLTLEARHYFLC